MVIFELTNSEAHPAYQQLEIENGSRQYDFLRSLVAASLSLQRPFLSTQVIKALNFLAIACLHTNAGEYRPCPVTVGNHTPPDPYRVEALMEDFVNSVNRYWESTDPVALAAFVLWRLNHIHPFINGNGRTARAACYFVLCVKAGQWLPGTQILPELIRQNRAEYVTILENADRACAQGTVDMQPLHQFLIRLLTIQLSPQPPSPAAAAP